jgi:hypothetical protein
MSEMRGKTSASLLSGDKILGDGGWLMGSPVIGSFPWGLVNETSKTLVSVTLVIFRQMLCSSRKMGFASGHFSLVLFSLRTNISATLNKFLLGFFYSTVRFCAQARWQPGKMTGKSLYFQ